MITILSTDFKMCPNARAQFRDKQEGQPRACPAGIVGILAGRHSAAIVWLAAIVSMIAASRVTAAEICRDVDAIWEISSRALPDCPRLDCEPQFGINEIVGGCWRSQTLDALHTQIDSHPDRRIVFYVHGNRMPQAEARQRALIVYQRLVCSAATGPICFIAFSWPSERREGFARDVINIKTRLDTDAYYFASFIQRLQLHQPVGFLGYSFGGAVVCGARHLLAGGELCGYRLPTQPGLSHPIPSLPTRISLIAPAFDRQELTSRGRYHLALDETDSVVNLYNSRDPILRLFRFFDRASAPIAAGFTGLLQPRSDGPLSVDVAIEQYDCRCIGRTHLELDYLTCPAVNRAFENVLSQPSLEGLSLSDGTNDLTHGGQSVPQSAPVE